MSRSTAILLVLLVATNAAWLVALATRDSDGEPPASGVETELATLRERVQELEARLEAKPAEATLTGSPSATASEGPAGSPPAPRPAPRRVEAPAPSAGPSAEDRRLAAAKVGTWKADVLQIQDPARRESGLAAFEDGIRSRDPVLAAASLYALRELRDAAYDKSRFREAVRSRLDDEDRAVRSAASSALLRVEPEPSDLDRLLDVLEAHPDDTGALIVGAWLAKSRVEGRLADLYVQALATDDPREAVGIANQLRGMWVTPEVEQAAVDAYRRRPASERVGLWFHILGQFHPTRESRVRLIFEILKTADTDAPQLLSRALEKRNLEPDAAVLAADLALETLPEAPNVLTRRLCLDVLGAVGTSAHVAGLRAYADNPMVAEDLRKQAARVADEIERR